MLKSPPVAGLMIACLFIGCVESNQNTDTSTSVSETENSGNGPVIGQFTDQDRCEAKNNYHPKKRCSWIRGDSDFGKCRNTSEYNSEKLTCDSKIDSADRAMCHYKLQIDYGSGEC